jgi:diguanylate cyclase (GGDEF)-like protein
MDAVAHLPALAADEPPSPVTRLLEAAPYEPGRRYSARERATEAAFAVAFLAASVAMVLAVEWQRTLDVGPVSALVIAYAVAARVPFHAGAGMTVPTQLVLVPLLFAAPTPLVPLLVAAGLMLSALPDVLTRRGSADRLLSSLCDAWYAVGPALVLAAAGTGGFEPEVARLLIPAFAAQMAGDVAFSSLREWIGRGIRPTVQLHVVAWICAIDALLTPVGVLAAWAAVEQPYAPLLALSLVGALRLLAHDRADRIRRAVELSRANVRAGAELERERAELASTRQLANTDALTGLANHRRLHELLATEARRLDGTRPPLALIMLDVDDFKHVNDGHGHHAGDIVLRRLAEVLRACCRESDEPARYGGEEFGIVLPRTAPARAYEVAERIRCAIEALEVALPGVGILRITASLGVAATTHVPVAHAELLKAADGALYEAKRAGKNRTVCAAPGA